MLTITESTSPEQAISYHTKDQARENYYANSQEMPGRWGGRGAARLGIAGEAATRDFERMCYNLHPATGEQLTLRMNANRRVGYDFTFSAPKSVSLLYEWTGDSRVLVAFDRAITRAMDVIEENAATRVRKNGKDENRLTKELVYCQFDHFTARPVDEAPDPQMHRHCYVFNATFDPVEKTWKAGQFGDIKAEGEHYQTIWLSEFSQELATLGYEIVPTGKFFEIGGLSRSLIEKFSKRTATIHSRAEELGISDPKQLAELGAKTRKGKNRDLSQKELHEYWWGQLTPEDVQQLNAAARTREREQTFVRVRTPSIARDGYVEPSREDLRAVRLAVEHLFERESVVTERKLITEAMQWGYGKTTLSGITAAVKDWTLLRAQRKGQTLLTTRQVLAEEQRIVARCQSGKNTLPSLKPDWEILDERLNEQQRAAVMHILTTKDFVAGIVGKAGAGKTTALKQAANGIRAAGKMLMVFAPTAMASRGNLREEGFKQAETVNKLLMSPKLQNEARGAVWFVDEGGLMSARITDELLALADRLGARVIIVGDDRQHHSVERGDAFRLLQEKGGIEVVTLDEIQRQKGDYKRAVELIEQRQFTPAFEVLTEMGALHEIPFAERQKALAKRYMELRAEGKSVQIVAPTHREGELVTQAIREAMKQAGKLGENREWTKLQDLSWTKARKRDARSYSPGLVVQFNQDAPGFKPGEQAEVIRAGDREVTVRDCKGEEWVLPLNQPGTFNIYKQEAMELGVGETITITANSHCLDGQSLNNGDTHVVTGFGPQGEIILDNGGRLGPSYGHLNHGYTETSHSIQSLTVDWVLVAQSALYSSGASNANQFYVTVSRGQKGVDIYTDNIESLREMVTRVRDRMLAMDLFSPEQAEQAKLAERSREALGRFGRAEGIEMSAFAGRIEASLETVPKSREIHRSSLELGQHGKGEITKGLERELDEEKELELEMEMD